MEANKVKVQQQLYKTEYQKLSNGVFLSDPLYFMQVLSNLSPRKLNHTPI